MFIATVVVGVLLAAMYLAAGLPKTVGAKKANVQARELGIAPRSYRLIGGLEILGATGVIVGLWLSGVGVAAGIGLTLLMVGAVATHIRARQSTKTAVPAIVGGVLALAFIALRLLSV